MTILVVREPLICKVRTGEKTRLRTNQFFKVIQPNSVFQVKPKNRWGIPFAHVRVTKTEERKLNNVTDKDIKLEGFSSREEFDKYYKEFFRDYKPDMLTLVVDFVRV